MLVALQTPMQNSQDQLQSSSAMSDSTGNKADPKCWDYADHSVDIMLCLIVSVSLGVTLHLAAKKHIRKTSKTISGGASMTAAPMPDPDDDENRDDKYRGRRVYDKDNVQVDYEYYGNGKGNVHIHTPKGKLYYDPVNNVLCTDPTLSTVAPKNIQKLLSLPDILKALAKGLKYIGG